MKNEQDPNSKPAASGNGLTSNNTRNAASGGTTPEKAKGTAAPVQFPSLALTKGGGAIQGIGEKFQANPVTGTGSMSVSIAMNGGRGFALYEKLNCAFFHAVSTMLNDPSLDTAKLQRHLGMSRSDLHRKLKAATGMSTTAYIRYLRLHRAAELLLEQPGACILGIALEVGFNNHSYFSKRFREVFGLCPVEYRERGGNLGHLL